MRVGHFQYGKTVQRSDCVLGLFVCVCMTEQIGGGKTPHAVLSMCVQVWLSV